MATHASHDIAQRITDQLIGLLDQVNIEDFVLPWHKAPVRALKPLNPITGTVYRGINWFELMLASGGGIHFGVIKNGEVYPSARWATYRQWLQAGGQVRKGEHGTGVVFYTSYEKDGTDEEGKPTKEERKAIRVYTVFAAEQVQGAEGFLPQAGPAPAGDVVEAAENLIRASGADITYSGNSATCLWLNDGSRRILLPERSQFATLEGFYATAFHELIHWAKREVGRDAYLVEHFPEGEARHAFEELVAELGAAMLCGYAGVSNTPRKDHAQYLKSWLVALRGERGFLMRAAAQAQKAVDWLAQRAGLTTTEPAAQAAEKTTEATTTTIPTTTEATASDSTTTREQAQPTPATPSIINKLHQRPLVEVLTPAGALPAAATKSKADTSIWYYQGDYTLLGLTAHSTVNGHRHPGAEQAKADLNVIKSASAAGWRLTNRRAGRLGTVWTLERDQHILTRAGALGVTTDLYDRPDLSAWEEAGYENMVNAERALCRKLNAWLNTLPIEQQENRGVVSRKMGETPIGAWARIEDCDSYGVVIRYYEEGRAMFRRQFGAPTWPDLRKHIATMAADAVSTTAA